MNQRGQDHLVQAALRGIKQARGAFHIGKEVCAMGAIHLGEHNWDWEDAVKCSQITTMLVKLPCQFTQKNGLDKKTRGALIDANDKAGWDFLTIARKLGQSGE